MNEMAVTADRLIVIGRGKLIADSSTQEFIDRSSERSVLVRTPEAARLADLITAEGGKVAPREPAAANGAGTGTGAGSADAGSADALAVSGLEAPRIGEIAASAAIVLHELTPQRGSLEEAFMELTAGSLEFGVHGEPAVPAAEGSSR